MSLLFVCVILCLSLLRFVPFLCCFCIAFLYALYVSVTLLPLWCDPVVLAVLRCVVSVLCTVSVSLYAFALAVAAFSFTCVWPLPYVFSAYACPVSHALSASRPLTVRQLYQSLAIHAVWE